LLMRELRPVAYAGTHKTSATDKKITFIKQKEKRLININK
jgi:hypothetical protein